MDLSGKRVLVIGLAKSGAAAAKLLRELGASVTVSEVKSRADVLGDVTELEALGITVVTGEHSQDLLDDCGLIVKNPGVPYDRPLIRAAQERGIPIITEVELAYLTTAASIIGITGTNGKTTTTSLIAAMFAAARIPAVAVGNIGTPLSAIAKTVEANTWLIAELSSFQLQGTHDFRPRIAALLNVYPAHLDYHGSIEAYKRAKGRLFANQTEEDIAVLVKDHSAVLETAAGGRARVWWVSLKDAIRPGVYVRGDELLFAPPDSTLIVTLAHTDEVKLRGRHNLENAAVAAAVALAADVPIEAVADALRTFGGVEHRLEFVREVRGVKFYNDSKATNPEAAIRAITSFSEPVIAILGGLDRGDDLTPLDHALRGRVKAAIVIGQSAARMAEAAQAAGVQTVRSAPCIEDAVAQAHLLAVPGDVVVLSPAAASWDMFRSFEERGRIFKAAVHML